MNNNKIYENVCTMLYQYDKELKIKKADEIINNPAKWESVNAFPFYATAAKILIECRKEIDKKKTPNSMIRIAKKIIKNASKLCPKFKGIWLENDMYCITDGHRAIRIKENITSLPQIQNDFKLSNIIDNIVNNKNYKEIVLPDITTIKTFILNGKARSGREWNSKQNPYKVNENLFVNSEYLLDMLSVFQNAKVLHSGIYKDPIYFKSENGNDGILLPMFPPKRRG